MYSEVKNKIVKGKKWMWYSDAFKKIHVSPSVFYSMATSNLSLVRDFTNENIPFVMVDPKELPSPAAADVENRKIYLNEMYFKGIAPQFEGLSVAQKLESLSWYVLHEAGHIRLTPSNWLHVYLGDNKNDYTKNIANLVEDVFIENAIVVQNENFEELMHSSHEVIFSDMEIIQRRSKAVENKPSSLEEVASFIDYMITWKRYTVFELSPFQQSVYDVLMQAKGLYDIRQRAEILAKIVEMLMDEKIQKEAQEKTGGQGNGEKVEGDGQSLQESEEREFFDQLGKMMKLGDSLAGKKFEPRETNYEIEDADLSEDGSITTIKLLPTDDLKVDVPNFKNLRKIEVGRGSIRSVRGQPKSMGKKITNIKHYQSGNIFGNQVLDGVRAGEGSPELIILVDGSGSMSDRTSVVGYRDKFEAAVAQAVAVAKALEGSKVKLGIYIHTCGSNPDYSGMTLPINNEIRNGILIQVLKGIDESVSLNEIQRRAGGAIRNFCGAGNADACAIAHVSSLFKGNGDKIIVVVSDGLPAEYFAGIIKKYKLPVHNGSYYERVKSTALAVDALRKRGIKIFSISIDKAAIDPCNKIYGVANNVYADDVGKFENMIISSTD